MNKKISLTFYLIIYGFCIFSINLVHPVTPKFFHLIHYPDYMFGLAFSLMALGGFLLSPMWSALAHRYGYAKIMSIGLAFYAVGQLMFSQFRAVPLTIFARLFGGSFSSGMNVGSMLFLANYFGQEGKAERITLGTAVQVVSGSIGYFVGGFIGNQNPLYAFYFQIIICFLVALTILLTIHEKPKEQHEPFKLSSINPLKAFYDVGKILNKKIVLLYALTVCAFFSFVAFENTFHYYLKKVYDLNPIYNGVIKGSVGLLGFVLNLSVNKWFAKKFRPSKIMQAFTMCIIGVLVFLINSNAPIYFIAFALLYYVLDTLQKPILQIMGTETPLIYGGFNTMLSLGQITGSLSAGYLFTIHPKLPFYVGLIVSFIALVIVSILKREMENSRTIAE